MFLAPRSASRGAIGLKRIGRTVLGRRQIPFVAMTAALCLLGMLSSPSAALADILHVEADGSGEYATIGDAAFAANPGDIIELGDGTYTGAPNVMVYFEVPLTLRSASGDPAACTIDGEALGGEVYAFEETVLEGITFNSVASILEFGGTVRDCIVQNGFWSGLSIYGGLVERTRFLNISGSAVYTMNSTNFIDCWFEGNTGTEGVAIYMEDRTGASVFERCSFINNHASSYGVITVVERFNRPVFRRCTFYGNHATNGGAVATMVGLPPQLLTFENCILMNSTGGPMITCGDGVALTVEMTCSISYGNQGGDFTGCMSGLDVGFDNLSVDPLFCDPGGGDFRISTESPAAPFSPPNELCDIIGSQSVGCGDPSSVPPPSGNLAALDLTVYPNPAAGFDPASVSIRLTSQNDGPKHSFGDERPELVLTDVSGRRIQRLSVEADGERSWSAAWDGRRTGGIPVDAGVYFLRASYRGTETEARLVWIP